MNESKSRRDFGSSQIYGSFYLAESEFALAVSCVQEVVNAPSSYTSVPLAPVYLKGLFNLRGAIIPVIDLKTLFNLSNVSPPENQKVAIIELDGNCVGLLFDKTGEVFRSLDEEKSDFDSPGVVSGVFKKNQGKRIVQILDIARIFKLHDVPKDTNRNRLMRDNITKKRGQRKQCISFIVGPAKCALPISDIQEILKTEKLTESALGAGFCIGTLDLRGSTVPVIDFPALLKYRDIDRSASATQGDRRVVVMKIENELFGLLVDSIDSIVSFFADELLTFPLIEQGRKEMFVGCITQPNEADILLLDHQKILESDEINEITRGHSKLYQSRSYDKAADKIAAHSRRTYITFRIGSLYAVQINDIKEIIDYPNSLLQPPGLKKHVLGVLNLRGDLVTIVDARKMYATPLDEVERLEPQKVLVFNRNGVHFGLTVDSVESIITFNDHDKVKMPPLLYDQGEGSMTADISEAIEVVDSNGQKRNLLIISADSVAARASKSLAA